MQLLHTSEPWGAVCKPCAQKASNHSLADWRAAHLSRHRKGQITSAACLDATIE